MIIDSAYIVARVFLDRSLFGCDFLLNNTEISWNGGDSYSGDPYIGNDDALFLNRVQVDVSVATGVEGSLPTSNATDWIPLFQLGTQPSEDDSFGFLWTYI